jgi:acyl carrier protein
LLDILAALVRMIEIPSAKGVAMDRTEIERELRELIRDARSRAPGTQTDQAGAGAVVENIIDSLEGVELALAAEQKFGVRIPDSDLNRVCRSIPKMAELIEKRMAAKAAAGGVRGG